MPALALVLRDKISPKVSLGFGLTEENGEAFLSWLSHTGGRCLKEWLQLILGDDNGGGIVFV